MGRLRLRMGSRVASSWQSRDSLLGLLASSPAVLVSLGPGNEDFRKIWETCIFLTFWNLFLSYFSHVVCESHSPSLSLSVLSPLVVLSLSYLSVSLFLFCIRIHLYCVLDSTYKWHHILFVFFWLISLSLVFCRSIPLLQTELFPSFVRLSSIPLCVCTASSFLFAHFWLHQLLVKALQCRGWASL